MKHLNVPTSDDLHKRLKHYAVEVGKSLSDVVRTALCEFIEKEEKKLKKR